MRFVGGNDGRVFIVDRDGVSEIGTYEWGVVQNGPVTHLAKGNYDLVYYLLRSTVSEHGTQQYRMRFLHRTFGKMKLNQPWTYTQDEILAVIDEIKKTEREAAPLMRGGLGEFGGVTPEPNPAAGTRNKGGVPSSGYGGNDSAPDRKR